MRKLIVALLVVAMMVSTAMAEGIDLSGLSYDELVALKDRINLAIWESEEWQEVTVPQGRWIVGEDIPAGTWTIKCSTINPESISARLTQVEWGEKLDEDGDISFSGRHGYENIFSPESEYYEAGDITEITVELQDGDIVDIDTNYGPAVFMPFAGKPSLGFK